MAEVLKQGLGIGFKCGKQEFLAPYIKGDSVAVDGTFYLTTDTHRLYVGDNGKAVPVNQGILSVANTTALGNIDGEPGQFYYIENSNILCVYSGTQWIQINTDTGIADLINTISSGGTNAARVNTIVVDSKGGEVDHSFDIAVKDGLTLTIDEDNLSGEKNDIPGTNIPKFTIAGDKSTLSAKTSTENTTNGATIQLSSTNGSATGSVDFVVTKNGTLTVDSDNDIRLEIKDTHLQKSETAGAGSIVVTEDATGFQVTIADSDGNDSFDRIDPQIKIGNAAAVPFVNGVATLDGYSKSEIDTKLQTLNAMVYRGTVGSSGGSAGSGLLLNDDNTIASIIGYKDDEGDAVYRVGDTFLLLEDFSFKAAGSNASTKYEAGSLIIAKGTETNGIITADLQFDAIEESNNTDTTYTFTEATEAAEGVYDAGYGINLTSDEGAPGTLILKGKNVTDSLSVGVEKVSSTDQDGGTREVISFVHDSTSQKDSTGADVDFIAGKSFTAVTGVTRDGTGHIRGIQTTKVQLGAVASSIADDKVETSVKDNVGTVSHKIIVNDAQGVPVSETETKFDLKSDTFQITDSDTTVGSNTQHGLKINMVWGSFE